VELRIAGRELNGLLKLRRGIRIVAETEVENSEIDMRLKVAGLELNGFGKGLRRVRLPALHGAVSDREMVPCVAVPGLELQHAPIAFRGLIVRPGRAAQPARFKVNGGRIGIAAPGIV
jgi:hypothetical protein